MWGTGRSRMINIELQMTWRSNTTQTSMWRNSAVPTSDAKAVKTIVFDMNRFCYFGIWRTPRLVNISFTVTQAAAWDQTWTKVKSSNLIYYSTWCYVVLVVNFAASRLTPQASVFPFSKCAFKHQKASSFHYLTRNLSMLIITLNNRACLALISRK